ncbi:MAG TPA: deoxyhypusine synthase family protein [Candidatus Lokiarchaeia archaeon]|nr:deoxyhypusine synthase family protein [Candidatus Lokiarchaeia archaeon]
MEKYLQKKIQPFDPSKAKTVEDVLVGLQSCSFQGRNLGQALEILTNMVEDKCFRVLTLAGAMVPAGMEEIICQLIERKIVNTIVSTGANVIHSIMNALDDKDNQVHFIGTPDVDDRDLYEHQIDRVYDTFLREPSYWKAEDFILEKFMEEHDEGTQVILTPSEFYAWLASHLPGRSFIKVAADNGVPVFNPAFSDSDLGLDVSRYRRFSGVKLLVDEVGDIEKYAQVLMQHDSAGTIILGGGVPRNWAQQIFPYLENIAQRKGVEETSAFTGFKYSVRFHSAVPDDGGLSGCTLSEAVSWGKYQPDAKMVSVWADSTIVFPILITALFERMDRLGIEA